MEEKRIFKVTFRDLDEFVMRFLASSMREALEYAEEYNRAEELCGVVRIEDENAILVKV